MSDKTTHAINHLAKKLAVYDDRKEMHAESTAALKEAKEDVDTAARAVVNAQDGAASLFDAVPA